MTEKQFTIVRELDAPRETVWRAWTDPAIAAQWWHPHGLVTPRDSVHVDLREGGSYAYTMVEEATGDSWPTGGTYLEVREPERLRFTWGNPGDAEGEAPVLTVELRELEGGRTEMIFHVLGIDEDRASEQSVFQGWTEAFEELDDALVAAR
ncbi:SRPBCC family protein [Agrococcus terreus]|uniref:Activator of HSP90 ATPase n=1 Tax=Agrococcus terreus TaxID=574649 RepID=A0ABQ2KPI9_9MICO|nr:SRPBCC domain-containing protein [Agrococcus terreus]GGN89398.1 activator of HSP90 ATPase [Agrococcus terreus]